MKVINRYEEDPFNEIALKGGIGKISPWLAQNPPTPPPPPHQAINTINNDRSLIVDDFFIRRKERVSPF